jgi:hypothetical protein
MAFTIDKAKVKTFENTVRFLAQQGDSRVWKWVGDVRYGPTASHSFKRIGKAAMSAKVGRRVATPEIDTVWSNRVVTTSVFDVGDTTEKEDEMAMVLDPKSAIVQNFGMAGRRQLDDIVIDAADANAPDEDGGANAFPAGQIIGAGGASEISFDIVTQINELFQTNDVDPDEPKVALIGPKQARKLLHEAKATNRDYVGEAQTLVNGGYVKRWMGMDWILTNRLNSPGAGRLNCLFMTRKAMGALLLEDITTEIGKDPSKSFMWRVYARLTAGAVRVEDEHIVKFDAKDTVTVA